MLSMAASTWGNFVSDQLACRNLDVAQASQVTRVPTHVLSQWINDGTRPAVVDLRKFAIKLGIPPLTTMIAAGYLSLEEAGIKQSPFPTLVEANLVDIAREMLRRAEDLSAETPLKNFRVDMGRGVTVNDPPDDENCSHSP